VGFPLPLLHSISSYDGRTENLFLGSSLVFTAGSEQKGLLRLERNGAFLTTFLPVNGRNIRFPFSFSG